MNIEKAFSEVCSKLMSLKKKLDHLQDQKEILERDVKDLKQKLKIAYSLLYPETKENRVIRNNRCS